MEKRIYLADDEPDIREVTGQFLEHAGYACHTFATGDELLAAFQEDPCDLVILDIMMPGTDGLTICKNLREISDVPIIILTAKESETDHMRGFMLGSDDYLIKPFSPQLLVVRIDALFRRLGRTAAAVGASDSAAQPRTFGDLSFSESEHAVMCQGKDTHLTMTEFALFSCLMRNPGTAVSRDTLLDDVWGIDAQKVETRVTDETVRRIRRKLKEAGSSVRIIAVWGYGYKLESSRAPT